MWPSRCLGRALIRFFCPVREVLAWPVVIPFVLLIAANFMMIRVCFLLPTGKEKAWHKADGGESGALNPFDLLETALLRSFRDDINIYIYITNCWLAGSKLLLSTWRHFQLKYILHSRPTCQPAPRHLYCAPHRRQINEISLLSGRETAREFLPHRH